jgi:hypothetical protein
MKNYIQLYSDSSRGVTIPKHFAESVVRERVSGIDLADLDYLLDSDITDDGYWDTWDDVVSNVILTYNDGDQFTLHQNGDLFTICLDKISDEQYLEFFGEPK